MKAGTEKQRCSRRASPTRKPASPFGEDQTVGARPVRARACRPDVLTKVFQANRRQAAGVRGRHQREGRLLIARVTKGDAHALPGGAHRRRRRRGCPSSWGASLTRTFAQPSSKSDVKVNQANLDKKCNRKRTGANRSPVFRLCGARADRVIRAPWAAAGPQFCFCHVAIPARSLRRVASSPEVSALLVHATSAICSAASWRIWPRRAGALLVAA